MEPEHTKKNPPIDFAELHRRAENLLQHNTEPAEALYQDVANLIHELSIYKTQLELQNEDLRNTEQELERSRRRYIDLYDFTPVAYLTISEAGRIVEANLAAADMLGVDRRGLLNTSFTSFIDPNDQDTFRNYHAKLPSTGKQSFELRLHQNDGTPFHALVETASNSDGCDLSGQYLISINNITDPKEAEIARLRLLKERYWAIVQDQTELIYRVDPEDRITFVNDAFCRFFDIDCQEILSNKFQPHIYEDDLPRFKDRLKNLTRKNPEKTVQYRVVLPDGSIRWQQWCTRALFDGKDTAIEYQAVGRDITVLKEIEEKLQSELNMRQLFLDGLPCIALYIDSRTYRIIAANKAAKAAGGIPGEQCYQGYMKQNKPCSWCRAANAMAKGQVINDKFWDDGKYCDTYWVPVDKYRFLYYIFDITEQQKISEALERANDLLEMRVSERTRALEESHGQLLHSEKLAAIGNLSASIAHEFNNPLHCIMVVLSGLETGTSLSGREKKLVSLALKEAQRMKNLIASLRDFHRPTSGKAMQVEVHSILDELLTICDKDFRTRNVTVQKKYADHLPSVCVVVDQIKQVFLNLLNNASDACEGGGKISVATASCGQDIIVSIEDSGTGISAANLPHIFEPFFTTKSELTGTGLGLSLSHGIVKNHGGRIEVESIPGIGSTFSVFLPVNGTGKVAELDTSCR
jgi:PAS domain S-box-containing protein